MEHGIQVDREAAVPIVFAQGQQVTTAVDASVVDQHVDAPEFACNRLHQATAGLTRGNVRGHRPGLATRCFDGLGHGLRRLEVDVTDHHRGAFACQPAGNGGANASSTTGNDCHFVLEPVHRRLLFCCVQGCMQSSEWACECQQD
ncbi:hypothetical protein D9M71_762400 [compost metagenome]